MKLAKKFLLLCVMTAMICAPASAEDVVIDTSLLMFGSATLTVNVDGELSNALSGTYTPGDVVTVKAPDVAGKSFTYWTNGEGQIISYNAELTLTIYSNTVLNAVYGTEAVTAQPAAEFLSVTRSGNQIMFNVMATAQSDITEYGIRYSTTKNTLEDLKGDDGITTEKADSSSTNWLFNVAASDNTTYYATAYVVCGGTTYYSDVNTVVLSELGDGVMTIAMLIDLLLGESLDNVGEEVITTLQASLCTVTYDANGGSGAMPPQGFLKDTASALNANTFTRSYYTFSGWNTKADGTGTSYQDGASITLTANTTLYAQWENTEPVMSSSSYTLTAYKGQSSSLTISATGIQLEWSMSGSLPAGMTFSSAENSATISGTPELGTSGSYALTVTASNAGGSASANVTITIASDFAESGDVKAGTPATTTHESGGSTTTTQTVFKNGAGQTILTADVSITTES